MESQETINDNDTIKIDPSDLSDEVVGDLIEEGAFDKEDAKKYGDRVWFEQVETPRPTKKEGLAEKVYGSISEAYRSWERQSPFVDLESVVRTEDDGVQINMFHHEIGERKATFSSDSSILGNIMALADVDNPKELEGGQLVVEKKGSECPVVAVPNNLSVYGQVKYKIYSFAKHVLSKTKIESINEDNVFGLCMVSMFCLIPAAMSPLLGILILPALITSLLLGFLVLYGLFRFTMYSLSAVSSTEVSEIRIRK